MNPRYLRGVLTPSQGYICVQCRLDHAVFQAGRTRRYQQTSSQPVKNESLPVLVDKTLGQTTLGSDLTSSPEKTRGQSSIEREDAARKHGDGKSNTHSANARLISDTKNDLQTLQDKFIQQRLKVTRQLQERKAPLAHYWEDQSHVPQPPVKKPKALTKTNIPLTPEKKLKAIKKTSIPKLSDTKPKALKDTGDIFIPQPPKTKLKVHRKTSILPLIPEKKPKAGKKINAVKIEGRDKGMGRKQSGNKPQQEDGKNVNTAGDKADREPSVDKTLKPRERVRKTKETGIFKTSKTSDEVRWKGRKQTGSEAQQETGKTLNTDGDKIYMELKPQKKVRKTTKTGIVKTSETSEVAKTIKKRSTLKIKRMLGAKTVGGPKEASSAGVKISRDIVGKPRNLVRKLLVDRIPERPLLSRRIIRRSTAKILTPTSKPSSRHMIRRIFTRKRSSLPSKIPAFVIRQYLPKHQIPLNKRMHPTTSVRRLRYVRCSPPANESQSFLKKSGPISKEKSKANSTAKSKAKSKAKSRETSKVKSKETSKAKSKETSKQGIGMVKALELEISPIEIDQPPVPKLSYGLDRVLFNPGVYQLQDPRSRVFNFDPYLQSIMPIKEFEFNALKEYITSSRDESLKKLAQRYGKRYVGSSSSMTGVLAHFHFLLSQWRDINPDMLSKSFPESFKTFTELQRSPSAIFLRWRDGSYAIDADKEFDTANVLTLLGKSMEKLLTLDTKDFERYRKFNPDQVTPEESNSPETYHYSTMGDFLMRSQLDAHDPRLPGTGMFDLKTRAVVSVRMDTENYERGVGYQIKSSQGKWESYEREYFDMIRAAFLKYSLQVRMGRMDGIFVAFHNIQRIFGFQYIGLPEMDVALHGGMDTSIGDQEFKLSTDLLNKVLNKATEKYPDTSLRMYFETRDTATTFMYVFVEPVTEDQVQQIQSTNQAKILEFERKVLGLGSTPEGNEQDEIGNWADIQASVQEAMVKDERSIIESNEAEEELPETAGDRDSHSDKANSDDVFAHGDKIIENQNEDDLAASSGANDDHVDDEGQEDEGQEDEVGEEEVAEGAEGDVEEERTDQDIDGDVEKNVGEEVDHDVETNEVQQVEAGIVDEEEHGAADVAMGTDDTEFGQSLPRDSDNDGDTTSMNQESQQTPLDQDAFRANLEASNPDGPERSEQSDFIEPEAIKSPEKRLDTQSDAPFLDTVAQEGSTSQAGEIFAMALTIRNKINGRYVTRPNKSLLPKDDWTVEYSLAEVADATRAWSLYKACQARRMKKLTKSAANGPGNAGYIRELRELSRAGAIWRKKQDAKDRERPRYVVGQPLQGGGDEGKGEGSADP